MNVDQALVVRLSGISSSLMRNRGTVIRTSPMSLSVLESNGLLSGDDIGWLRAAGFEEVTVESLSDYSDAVGFRCHARTSWIAVPRQQIAGVAAPATAITELVRKFRVEAAAGRLLSLEIAAAGGLTVVVSESDLYVMGENTASRLPPDFIRDFMRRRGLAECWTELQPNGSFAMAFTPETAGVDMGLLCVELVGLWNDQDQTVSVIVNRH